MLIGALHVWRAVVRACRRPAFASQRAARIAASATPAPARLAEADAALAQEPRYVTPGVTAGRVATIYSDIDTELIECIWSESFHFAPRKKGERFDPSLLRLQTTLAEALGLRAGQRVLDAGCGVGGPMRNLARLTGATFVGVTINGYQAERAGMLIAEEGLRDLCSVLEADCASLPFAAATFDAAIAISLLQEVHDRGAALRELARVLAPGALLAGITWGLTARFQADNPEHVQVRAQLEVDGAMPPLPLCEELPALFASAGFEVIEAKDLAICQSDEQPWYLDLEPGWTSLMAIHRQPWFQDLVAGSVRATEAVGLAPRGTAAAVARLRRTTDGMAAGGRLGIYTGIYYFLLRRR